ncbi:unnamed protein product, partial [Didymodactylos carnosus]
MNLQRIPSKVSLADLSLKDPKELQVKEALVKDKLKEVHKDDVFDEQYSQTVQQRADMTSLQRTMSSDERLSTQRSTGHFTDTEYYCTETIN